MSDIAFVRRHSLPISKARTLVQKAADTLAAEHHLHSEWRGNTLHFHRAGVHGEIQVTDSHVRLDATLGLLLKPFKATFIRHIESALDEHLPKPKPAAAAKKPV